MKKILIYLFAMFIVTGCNLFNVKDNVKKTIEDHPTEMSIMQLDEYRDFSYDKISSLVIFRYTEGGRDEEKVTDKDRIQSIYNMISNYRIIGETNMACEDNTTVYRFVMKDGSKVTFEFECSWLVVGNKRYDIEKNVVE